MEKLLLIVDMLNDFVNEKGVLYFPDSRKIIEPIKERMEHARKRGIKRIFLCDSHTEDDKEFEKFPPHALEHTWGAEIIDELMPSLDKKSLKNEIILRKQRYSGFYNTGLGNFFPSNSKQKMVTVVGVCTSICVMDTVGGLANRDHYVEIPKDCVADFDKEMHEMSLKRMKNIYGANII